MMSVTDPNMSDVFTSAMREIQSKHLKAYEEITATTMELSQSHKQFMKSALGMIIAMDILYSYLFLVMFLNYMQLNILNP